VHCWANLGSAHGFRCHDIIVPNVKCQQVVVLALCLGNIVFTLIHFVYSGTDVNVHQYIIPVTVLASLAIILIIGVVVVCVKCPHFCVVDVMTYRQERNRLRKHMKQNPGKSLDLTHYLQRRQLQLEGQQANMNTVALYVAVSKKMHAAQ